MEKLGHKDNETIMKEAFNRSAQNILVNEPHFYKPPGLLVGLEMETSVIDHCGQAVGQPLRDRIVDILPYVSCELGASQLEWRTDPIMVAGEDGLEKLILQARQRDVEVHNAVRLYDGWVLRSGTNPFVNADEIVRTDKPKYRMVPDFHNQNRQRQDTDISRNGHIVSVGDAAVVSLLNSLQCNCQATDFADAVDKANRSLMIGPMTVALSANAGLLYGKDTGLADLRMLAWERSHDTRNTREIAVNKALRVGLPDRYLTDLEDYFDRIAEHPFILFDPDHALQIGIGLFWQDTRIKFIGNAVVVEFRPTSIQPTVEEDLAVMMFYLGRLQWSQDYREELTPIDTVRKQRNLAMNEGITPFLKILPDEIMKAKIALIEAGVNQVELEKLFRILWNRIDTGLTPVDITRQKREKAKRQGLPEKDVLLRAFGAG